MYFLPPDSVYKPVLNSIVAVDIKLDRNKIENPKINSYTHGQVIFEDHQNPMRKEDLFKKKLAERHALQRRTWSLFFDTQDYVQIDHRRRQIK